MFELRQLWLLNRQVQSDADAFKQLLKIEHPWISEVLQETDTGDPVDTQQKFSTRLEDLLELERTLPGKSALWLERKATLEEFRVLVQEFAIDGLTEAQSFFPILQRLPLSAQMPMLRILIDEFGCGNQQRSHSSLYMALLDELDMSTDYSDYLGFLNPESFAFLDIFYWLTQRAPNPGFFLGALAYLEASIPAFFASYAKCCTRLSIKNHLYYTEHMHIDEFHAREALRAIVETVKHGATDYESAWAGVMIGQKVTADAFEAAVTKAKRGAPIVWRSGGTKAWAS